MKIIILRSLLQNTTSYFYYVALQQFGHELIDIAFDHEAEQPERVFPDADLLILPDCGLPKVFPGLENFKGMKAYISVDSCHRLDVHQKYIDRYQFDYVFVAQKHVVDQLPRAHWLPLAACHEAHIFYPKLLATTLGNRMRKRNYYDIGMCGAPYKHRKNFAKLFKKAGLKTNFHFRKKFGLEVTRELAKCALGFNCGAGYTGEHGRDINMRVFETMANGNCALLTNVYQGTGMEELFEENRHYIKYESDEEAVDKALYYSRHPQEVIKIAQQAQQLALDKHLYKHRCETMFNIMGVEN
ncbi:MAG: glycosyltransferase [Gammaproteobacteria bacterium]|nr:glycosyltransferase [Gammaproteobacteria bacterium]